jgi:hypothetical protein
MLTKIIALINVFSVIPLIPLDTKLKAISADKRKIKIIIPVFTIFLPLLTCSLLKSKIIYLPLLIN